MNQLNWFSLQPCVLQSNRQKKAHPPCRARFSCGKSQSRFWTFNTQQLNPNQAGVSRSCEAGSGRKLCPESGTPGGAQRVFDPQPTDHLIPAPIEHTRHLGQKHCRAVRCSLRIALCFFQLIRRLLLPLAAAASSPVNSRTIARNTLSLTLTS